MKTSAGTVVGSAEKFDDSPVVDTVRRVTGRPPHTFEQWAEAHAHLFTG